ncbi:MotA/TolQ/ExbB proton channel family protein [Oceanobacillus halotolerans]|uniref:MotA/TolQ/ExbB proton channel family protein n=1 Tax=Oceanobacillus halotolerans TaxID=2663380 RepID=UPI0013DC72E8|nr:MotA/TolQ/ExbB proton channel family protein [Oceanobacillus halotolerans]
MLQSILEIVTSEQQAESILSNPIIELIFAVLFATFFITILIHFLLFKKLNKIRNYLKDTNRMDMEPLNTFKEQFDHRNQAESVKAETFVQEKFSSWRVFNVPVVNLIKMVQMTVSVFILIGVLGTFIGLTMSLGSINADGDQLVENVAAVLSGIDVAFYTSIAGMGFSLIMTILIKVWNTEHLLTDIMLKVESILEGNEQDGMNRLIDASETINQSILQLQQSNQQSLGKIEKAFQGFQEYTSGLQQSAADLAKFNEGLTKNLQEFQELFHNMEEVTDGFGEATEKLNNNFSSLFSYFKKMDGKNERMAKAFENTYERVKEVSTTQMDTLHEFQESVVELKDFTSSIMDRQESTQAVFEKIHQKGQDLADKMEAHNNEFKQVFGKDLESKLTGIIAYLGELSKDFNKLGDSVVQLPEALDVINRTQAEYKHLLSDRFEELKEFNRTFNQHLKAHSEDSKTFERQMTEAGNSFEKMGRQNNQLIHDINATITQLNNTFHQQDQHMEASVRVLKETLSNYVMSLEGTLGDKLGSVVRDMQQSAEQTNNEIKKEFKELQRTYEEMEQNNGRHMVQMLQELRWEIQRLNRQLTDFNQQANKNGTGLRHNDY